MNARGPVAKQRLVLQQFKPDIVVGRSDIFNKTVAGLDALPPLLDVADFPKLPFRDGRPAHKLAYVIFTSGSTGLPKGVMISRAALAHYAAWALEAMAVSPADRWSQHPNIGFDLSVLDIYGCLCGGATLFPLSHNEARLMPGTVVRQNALTIWNSVPSVIDIMRRARQLTHRNLASLRLMTFSASRCCRRISTRSSKRIPMSWCTTPTVRPRRRCPARSFASTATPTAKPAAPVAIGEPIEGMSISLRGSESGDEGEIVLTGPQLAAGYWNDAKATAAAFRDIETGDGARTRAYFTGDWAKRIDGKTYFANRVDFQVKINGFRLELDEVNAAIRKLGFTGCACAMVGGKLHAFVESGDGLGKLALRGGLESFLEPHAIPKHFHFIRALPRNANDKIDLKALIGAVSRQDA